MAHKADFSARSCGDEAAIHVFICPSCGIPCNAEELSECAECGDYFCGKAKSNCKAVCSCDVTTAEDRTWSNANYLIVGEA